MKLLPDDYSHSYRENYTNFTLDKTALLTIIFIIGLLFIDQMVKYWGDYAVRHHYFAQDRYAPLTTTGTDDLILLGDCRAVLLDTNAISEILQRKIVNMGAEGYGLGHLVFASKVLASHPGAKRITLFITDDSWQQNEEQYNTEISHLLLWSSHLKPNQTSFLFEGGSMLTSSLKNNVGLWKYRGYGPELIKSGYRALTGTLPPVLELQGFRQFADRLISPEQLQLKPNPTSFTVDKSYETRVEAILSEMRRQDIKVTLIAPPMHRTHISEPNRKAASEFITSFAQRHDLPLFNYLGNRRFAEDNSFWGDPGHLNRNGMQVYSQELANDLKKAL